MQIPEIESENIIEKKIVEVPLRVFNLLAFFTVAACFFALLIFSSLDFIDWKLATQAERQARVWETMAPGMFSRLDQIIKNWDDNQTILVEKFDKVQSQLKRMPKKVMSEINNKEYCKQKTKGDRELIEMCLESLE